MLVPAAGEVLVPGRHVARTLPPLAGLTEEVCSLVVFCLWPHGRSKHPIRCADEQRMRLCSFVASTALLTSANCLSAPRRRRLPAKRGGPEPATPAIKKNLARALALPVAAVAASRFEPVRKLMAFDRIRVGLVAGTVGAAILGGCYFIFSFCVMDALNAQGPANAIANICVDLPPSTQPTHG